MYTNLYMGKSLSSCINGYGDVVTKDVEMTGYFQNGMIRNGIIKFKDGNVYKGKWDIENNSIVFKGTKFHKDGTIYEGTWKHKKFIDGVITLKNNKKLYIKRD